MNAQKRRMREAQHKREIDRLWQAKLGVLREQREAEEKEQRQLDAVEAQKRDIIAEQKARLLAEHADILTQFNPKAASVYGTSAGFR